MNNYYRSRYVTFLNSLTESKREKQRQEELEKEKKDRYLLKLRNDLGLNNIQSKLMDVGSKTDTIKIQKKVENDDEIEIENKTEEEVQGIQRIQEINKKLFEKQKQHLEELKNRKIQERLQKEKEFQKKEKYRNDIKAQVLNQIQESTYIQTQEDILEAYKKISEHNQDNDQKVQSPHVRRKLKPVKETGNEDNDEVSDENSPKGSQLKKLRSYPFITDLKLWKKKQRLDESVRVFIIQGGYPDLKKALLQRGWVENPDHKSPCFELKFTLLGRDIDYNSLNEYQICNHFEKNTALTTKVGICKNLRNLIWFNNVDIDTFYPRCYDLNDEIEFQDFLEDFKTTKAQSILKIYMKFYKYKDEQNLGLIKNKVQVALKVLQRKIKDINEIIDDYNNNNQLGLVSQKEWDILSKDDLQAEALAQKKHNAWIKSIEQGDNAGIVQKKQKVKKQKTKNNTSNKGNDQDDLDHQEQDTKLDEFTASVQLILKKLKEKQPQYYMNGIENIWIIKPASLSRGRGIKCYKNLVEILDHMGSKESQWVIQKYIENPLIVMNRKMDIRQWVVITDFNPVTVWFYDECYIRFTAEEYDVDNLDNELQHLTNNSIQKKYLSKDDEIIGNMWYEKQFSEWLKQQYDGQDIFHEIIKPQMKKIIVWSIEAVQDQIEGRKNSFEMFGYDFMIDDRLNVALIEVNSSPAMDYSTHITEKLVKDVSNDLVKIIVDYGMSSKQNKKDIETGKFIQIYKSKSVLEKPNTLGLNLVIEGKQIKK